MGGLHEKLIVGVPDPNSVPVTGYRSIEGGGGGRPKEEDRLGERELRLRSRWRALSSHPSVLLSSPSPALFPPPRPEPPAVLSPAQGARAHSG
jgi:hypothetical protein